MIFLISLILFIPQVEERGENWEEQQEWKSISFENTFSV